MRSFPALLLLLAACNHAPAVPLPADGRRFEEPARAAEIRARILRHNAEVYACYQEAARAHPPQGHEASSFFSYTPALSGFGFERPPKDPNAKVAPATPFRAAFEACLAPRVAAWMLPPPDEDGSGARFHFLPPGAAMPPPPDLSKGPPSPDQKYGMDPDWSSPLFDEAGARGWVDIAGMTRPRRISGEPFRYTEEALAKRSEGMMRVRCLITTEGALRDCAVLDSRPGLDQMVIETLATHRYTPVRYRNKPVAVQYTFTLWFKLPKS